MEKISSKTYNTDCLELSSTQASKMKMFFLAVLLLTTIINMIFLINVKAQLVSSNNVLIANSGVITINGDILLNANASIYNSGTLELKGEWENNSGNNCFGTSNGIVKLTGNNQIISGASPTVFNNLIMLGTGTVKLFQHASCGGAYANPAGIVNLGNQNLDLNSYTLTVTNSSANAITNNTGYILSEKTDNSSVVKWQIKNNMGAHVVPFGNVLGEYIPLTFNLTNGNAGDVSFSTYATNAANQPLPLTPVAVTNIFNNGGYDNSANVVDRFWHIENSMSCTANLTFTYGNSEIAANGNTGMVAQNWNNASQVWNTPLIFQSNPSSNTVLTTGVQVFGTWAISKFSSPLPIKLLTYDAKPLGALVRNSWTTTSELNNNYFTIERSTDSQTFDPIGTIKGAGSSNEMHSYVFDDMKPLTGISYYRLKQTDINGAYSYSDIRKVNFDNTANHQITIFPNPTTDFVVVAATIEGVNDIIVSDSNGRIVKSINTANTITKIDLSELPSGHYFLQIKNAEDVQNAKIIKL